MMYQSKLAVAIKHDGKVLREHGDSVYLPFGSTYSVLVKNLSTVRALVTISIDGKNVTEAHALVVDPNSDVELERFIRNGNLNAGNKFKFIERSAAVEAARGVRVDDGLVRVEYQFEQPVVWNNITWSHPVPNPWDQFDDGSWLKDSTGNPPGPTYYSSNSIMRGMGGGHSVPCSNTTFTSTASAPGITAPGEISEQQFYLVNNFPLETTKHSLVLRLLGQVGEKVVKKSLNVKSRTQCVSCSKKAKPSEKFCSRCGTSLQII